MRFFNKSHFDFVSFSMAIIEKAIIEKLNIYSIKSFKNVIPTIKEVYPQQEYCLEVHFSNGEKGVLDMQPYLNFGVFKRLQDEQAFHQIKVVFDTLEWKTGVDLSSEFVYQKTKKIVE